MATNEIPAGALYGTPAERITRPNDGETIETRLGRLEREVADLRAALEYQPQEMFKAMVKELRNAARGVER